MVTSATRNRRRIGASLAVVALVGLSATTGSNAGAQSDDDITFTVGVSQEIDSLNVNIGVLVADYEVWNLQYMTLTDKSDADFSAVPGLAESWVPSDGGQTYTYTLREDLLWSDGTPLTAEDVAWTINTARDEEWINAISIVANLEATVIDERTVEVASSVPDPKLPVIDAYVLPKHVYEEVDMTTYDGETDVGSGPFTLAEHEPGQFWRMERNPNWYGFEPYVDEIVFQYFAQPDQMATALENGEVDAIDSVDEDLIEQLEANEDLVVVQGRQGGFSELALNAGDGLGDGHPALQDRAVRQAINWAIDREVLLEENLNGRGTVGIGMPVSASDEWDLVVPEDEQYTFDLDKANEILDEAGYLDTDDDGVREMPDGTNPLEFRLYIRQDSPADTEKAEFIVPWLQDIGIDTEVLIATEDELTAIIGRGEYDMFTWGWVPFVDPDSQLSYFTCDQLTTDPESPGYNDANWCTEEYDALYEEQNQELDVDRRKEIVQEMLRHFYDEAPYVVLYKYDDISAYSADWTGFVRQPAETGPVLFNNSSHSYQTVRPVDVPARDGDPTVTTSPGEEPDDTDEPADTTAGDRDDDSDGGGVSTGLIVGGIVAVGIVAAIIGVALTRGRREDRE